MAPHPHETPGEELDGFTLFLHLGLMIFGVLAWLTGEWAGDYKTGSPWGFTIHKMLGLGLVVFLSGRWFHGFFGPAPARFVNWLPYTPARLRLVMEDLYQLLRLQLPRRPPRQGLAGLWEAFGLAVFTWMAATGLIMFLFLPPGHKARGLLQGVKELHELGEILIPLFLLVHVGAVLLHALAGDHRWRTILFMKK